MENKLEMLKELYSHSSENVYILSYDLELIWSSKMEFSALFGGETPKKILENESKPIKSGEYFFRCGNQDFSGRIIDYPEQKLYILEISRESIIQSYFKCDAIKGFFSNHVAQVRQSVSGISAAVFMLRKKFDEEGVDSYNEYLDVTSGNCYKLLKSVFNTSELIKYSDEIPELYIINLTSMLNKFTDICKDILRGKIDLVLNVAPELYIKAEPNRLTACILSLIVAAGKNIPNCTKIYLEAEKAADSVSITVYAQSCERKNERRLLSSFERLYDSDASDSELLVISQFCHTFNGTFYKADDPESGGKIYSIKLPYCDDTGNIAIFRSENDSYIADKFSIHRIVLSELVDLY